MPTISKSTSDVLKILSDSFLFPSPSFMLARGAAPRPIKPANACIINVIGNTMPKAANASMPAPSILATNILSTTLYKKVMS